MTFTIELPYPDPVLNPNSRAHWRRVHAAKKEQRFAARMLSIDAFANHHRPRRGLTSAHVTLDFFPPDKRKRDRDNAFASCKALLDGIADALGIDDSTFTTSHAMLEPRRGGAVVVTVEAK